MEKSAAMDEFEELALDEDQQQNKKRDTSGSISPQDVLPAMTIDSRLLEYSMTLSYESDDILDSRMKLFSIISRYGFLTSSTTDIDDVGPYLSVSFKVRTKDIYSMLGQLEKVGLLKEENVSVTDMTPDNRLRTIQQQTERIRSARRQAALSGYNVTKKNYEERERMLEQSENNMDNIDFQLWQLDDRATWSTINVSVLSPDSPVHIEVPSFYNALINMINGLLDFIYYLIKFSPLIAAVILIIVIKRKKIISRIQRKIIKTKENSQ